MRQIEGRAHEDVPLVAPIGRGEDSLGHDVLPQVFHPCSLFNSLQHLIAILLLGRLPVMPMPGVDCRHEDIELRMPFGRHRGIGDTAIAHVYRHVIGHNFFTTNVIHVLRVVIGKENMMVWFVFVNLVEPEIEHEGRAGKLLRAHLLLGLARAIHQIDHGVSVVCIHDDVVGFQQFAILQLHAPGIAIFKYHLLHRGAEKYFRPVLFRGLSHTLGNFAKPALHVVDSVFVFGVGKDAEQGRTFPWAHSEILGLKGKSQLEAVIFKKGIENIHDTFRCRNIGNHLEQFTPEIRRDFVIRLLQTGINRT